MNCEKYYCSEIAEEVYIDRHDASISELITSFLSEKPT